MRATLQVIGVIVLINGAGPYLSADFGLLPGFVEGGTLAVVQIVAILAGIALIVGGLTLPRQTSTPRGST